MGWSVDIASADAMRCKLHDADYKLARYAEVVAAVNERASAAGIATLTAPVRLDLWPNIRTAVQAKVSALFGYYAKHTDSGGNWDGQATIQVWSEADILTAISTTRIPAQVSTDIPAWLNQQYRIINLLRWVYPLNIVQVLNLGSKVASGSTWNELKTNFLAATWGGPQIPNNPLGHYVELSSGYSAYRGRYSVKYRNISDYTYSVDIYTKTLIPSYWIMTYENSDYSVDENEYALVDASAGITGQYVTPMIGNIDDVTLSEPSSSGRYGWAGGIPVCVAKFDISGGFEYGDWA